jgi:hypothetical protein
LNADVNGDALADIVIGDSSTASGGLAGAGAAYVIFGKTDTTSVEVTALQTRGFVIRGSIANGLAGYAAAIGGDLDQDTLADVVIGAPGATSTDAGRTYVVRGATATADMDLGAPSERVLTMTTGATGDRLASIHRSSDRRGGRGLRFDGLRSVGRRWVSSRRSRRGSGRVEELTA